MLKNFSFLSLLFFFCNSCSSLNVGRMDKQLQTEESLTALLESDTVTIILEYAGWGCPCPQWISIENRKLYEEWKKENDSYPEDFFYNIIKDNTTVPNLSDLVEEDTPWVFEFTGQFYKVPMFMGLEGELWKGRTLRYYDVRVAKHETP
jgi:hypothetical protein